MFTFDIISAKIEPWSWGGHDARPAGSMEGLPGRPDGVAIESAPVKRTRISVPD